MKLFVGSAIRSARTDPARSELSARTIGSVAPTAVLDWRSAEIAELDARIHGGVSERALLQEAHALVQQTVRPVYGLNEGQRVSVTLRRGRGSCSQRLAVLEAVARRRDIRTRVRGLVVDGRFWHARFGAGRLLVPDRILLAWPEFFVAGDWLDVGRLFSGDAAAVAEHPFRNDGTETLFDAIARGAADWEPPVACICDDASLSTYVRAELGWFDSRDALYARYGHNLPAVRRLLDPVFRRWAAGAS
ncbi:hypothetical protein [Microbacterium sp. SORGH_AS_0888]|uniref:hypothetical protein n=1 Tax=Microbacterium sp. SORGH_AS_0888 TaxID=3041791 RepID=UPI0027802C3C|nr:hypothetical protein [Microbacterium sp. SORGH_AS_0888]MDQ1128479.1 hypothetical protein [Microbacterium sp. SORGH_AS_0888]